MRLIINGNTENVSPEFGVADVAQRFSSSGRGLVVQLNEVVIRRNDWSDHRLKDGDRLDILRLVGGG